MAGLNIWGCNQLRTQSTLTGCSTALLSAVDKIQPWEDAAASDTAGTNQQRKAVT